MTQGSILGLMICLKCYRKCHYGIRNEGRECTGNRSMFVASSASDNLCCAVGQNEGAQEALALLLHFRRHQQLEAVSPMANARRAKPFDVSMSWPGLAAPGCMV
jgi:hypothetical protein